MDTQIEYSVGQILFVLLKKERAVLPIRIVEQVIRQTVDKKIISYMVMLPNDEETVMKLEKLNADIFLSIDDVRKKMLDNATVMIEKIIDNAENVKNTKFGVAENNIDISDSVEIQDSSLDNKKLEVTFDDGTVGKIDMSNIENNVARNKWLANTDSKCE